VAPLKEVEILGKIKQTKGGYHEKSTTSWVKREDQNES
jgi:hypothetical protein